MGRGRQRGDRKCTSALYVSAQVRPVQLKILVREVCLRGHVRAGEKEREKAEKKEKKKWGRASGRQTSSCGNLCKHFLDGLK